MICGMRAEEVTASRWGCSASAVAKGGVERPKHLVDQDYYARTGKVVSLCGYELEYVDGQTEISVGQYLCGRDILRTRKRQCVKCLRRESEVASDVVTIPLELLKRLNVGETWESVSTLLDASILQQIR